MATWLRRPSTFQVLLRVLPCPNILYGLFPRWFWENAPSGVSSYLENGPFTDFFELDLLTEFDAVHQVLMHQTGLSPKWTGYSCRTEINVEKIHSEDVQFPEGRVSSWMQNSASSASSPRLSPWLWSRPLPHAAVL